MKSNFSPKEAIERRKELLLEFFLTAFALAFVKELALAPVPIVERQGEIPPYYRG